MTTPQTKGHYAMNFATMTHAEALNTLISLDAAKWGDQEREASRRLHAGKTRGLLINAIVHHQANDYGDAFDAATKKLAGKQLTPEDHAQLRKGG